jgi:hypothetical protein
MTRKVSDMWTCPRCGLPQDRPFDECPNCGVIVEKFKAKQEPEIQPIETSVMSRSVWIGGAVALVVIVSLLFYAGSVRKQARIQEQQRIIAEQMAEREHQDRERMLQKISNMERIQREEAQRQKQERANKTAMQDYELRNKRIEVDTAKQIGQIELEYNYKRAQDGLDAMDKRLKVIDESPADTTRIKHKRRY